MTTTRTIGRPPRRPVALVSAAAFWPPPPIPGSPRLRPITSWAEMWEETRITNVEFDAFWLDHVESGVAYFFRWMGQPRATVLAIWNGDGLHVVECRGMGDRELTAEESREVVTEVHRQFAQEGFGAVFEGRA